MERIELKEVGVKLPTGYANEFKARTATRGTTMSRVIRDAIQEWMRKNPPPKEDSKNRGIV